MEEIERTGMPLLMNIDQQPEGTYLVVHVRAERKCALLHYMYRRCICTTGDSRARRGRQQREIRLYMAMSSLTLLDKGQLVVRLGAMAVRINVPLRLMYQDTTFPRSERKERLSMYRHVWPGCRGEWWSTDTPPCRSNA